MMNELQKRVVNQSTSYAGMLGKIQVNLMSQSVVYMFSD